MRTPSLRSPSGLVCAASLALTGAAPSADAQSLGIFQHQQDVGTVLRPGSAQYDSGRRTYTITGNGDNMWFAEDDFHYVWTKVSGDVALTADIDFANYCPKKATLRSNNCKVGIA